VANREQEHGGQQPVGDGDRGGHAEKLSHDHLRSRHRFTDHRQHRLVVDLPRQHARGREGRHQQSRKKERAEAEVDEQFVVVLERVAGDVDVQHERQEGGADQHGMDGLADRLEKSVAGEREEGHGNPERGAGTGPSPDFTRSFAIQTRGRGICKNRVSGGAAGVSRT
jgi:hypothetical protein